MKKAFQIAVATLSYALFLAGCASVDYQPYEGRNNQFAGEGGTKLTVEGIDFWANGNPPRQYKILGVATSRIGRGAFAEDLIRSAVASEVQKRGGDGAIQLSTEDEFSGIVPIGGMYTAAHERVMRFAIIEYLD